MQKKKFLWAETSLLFIFLFCIFLVKPEGDFPLNDDWVYSSSAENLLNTGKLRLNDWVVAESVFQIAWGALFSLLFGFSFNVLRLSTAVLAFLGLLFFYLGLRKLGFDSLRSFFAALLLLFNPLFLPLSLTFMTEIPFFSLMLISLYFYVAGFQKKSSLLILAGSLFAGMSLLVRQTGVFLPLGIFIFFFLRKELTIKKSLEIALIPFFLFLSYRYWFRFVHHSNWGHLVLVPLSLKNHYSSITLPAKEFFSRAARSAVYLGFFMFPLLLPVKEKEKRRRISLT